MYKGRIRFGVTRAEYTRINADRKKHNLSMSKMLKIIATRATNDLTDFSVLNTDFSDYAELHRYTYVETSFSEDQIKTIKELARMNSRSMASILFAIVCGATQGFSDYSIVNGLNTVSDHLSLINQAKEGTQ